MDRLSPGHWVREGWGFKAKSVDTVARAVSRVGFLATGRQYVWRGVSDARYPIASSLMRHVAEDPEILAEPDHWEDVLRAREQELIAKARDWLPASVLPPGASDFQVLTLLQHHGLPTRLLDVTSSPYTALWFATAGVGRMGALFAFEVSDFQTHGTAPDDPIPVYGGMLNPRTHRLKEALDSKQPFLVQPTFRDPRMIAQEGAFLAGAAPTQGEIPGVLDLPLMGSAPGRDRLDALFHPDERGQGAPIGLPFVAVTVPSRLKVPLRHFLETTFNRTRAVLFPDLAGLRDAFEESALALGPLADLRPDP